MTDLDELLMLARRCAHGAADILVEGRHNGFGQIDTKSSDVDIVTEIDRRSERYIVDAIRSERPDDSILGEEGTDHIGSSAVRWVIDPLDGTVNFTYGIPAYAVCVGVEVDGVPSIGVVLNPSTGEEFVAVTGQGATLNGTDIAVRQQRELSLSLVATGFSYTSDARAHEAKQLLRILPAVRDIRRAGSAALDLCSVACGRVDAYFEHSVNPWDVSAAYVVATEAGALATGMHGGIPRTDVIAANPSLHAELAGLLHRG